MVGAADCQDDVCLVIDMECFILGGRYHCRELGYCSWQGDSGRMAFPPLKPYKHLTVSERKNVHYLTRVIHGLAYQPQDGEVVGVCPLHFVRKLYREFATEH